MAFQNLVNATLPFFPYEFALLSTIFTFTYFFLPVHALLYFHAVFFSVLKLLVLIDPTSFLSTKAIRLIAIFIVHTDRLCSAYLFFKCWVLLFFGAVLHSICWILILLMTSFLFSFSSEFWWPESEGLHYSWGCTLIGAYHLTSVPYSPWLSPMAQHFSSCSFLHYCSTKYSSAVILHFPCFGAGVPRIFLPCLGNLSSRSPYHWWSLLVLA